MIEFVKENLFVSDHLTYYHNILYSLRNVICPIGILNQNNIGKVKYIIGTSVVDSNEEY